MMEFKTTEDKVCYGIGTQIGDQLKHSQFPCFNLEAVIEGINDSLSGKLQLDANDIRAAFTELNSKLAKEQAELAKVAREAGEKYLSENSKKEGVVVTASGLQYEILKEGDGETPKATDVVKVHYHGTLTDGTVFDSSVQRNEPAQFGVNQVIKGWVEALQLMKVGSKYRLTIPADLAYGDQGAGSIPPGSALVFEVELLDIVK
ncbi:MAG: FKBP-type peptidyl-prolyl cis-trans isomerase [Succinivibrionaceae bacterium]